MRPFLKIKHQEIEKNISTKKIISRMLLNFFFPCEEKLIFNKMWVFLCYTFAPFFVRLIIRAASIIVYCRHPVGSGKVDMRDYK